MPPTEDSQSKPAIFRRLAFLLGLSSLPYLLVGLSFGIVKGTWAMAVAGLVFCLIISLLAWVHFRGSKAGWYVGLVLNVLRVIYCVTGLPVTIEASGRFAKALAVTSPSARALAQQEDVSGWQRLAFFGICMLAAELVIDAAALVVALSPAARTAYGISRRGNQSSA